VPFIRHTRDKRGYETTYVMHAYRPLSGPQRTRILYLFRSPAHLKMGRRALDDEAREALEHTHLDVSFDWYSLDAESNAARAEPPRDRDRGRDRERPGRRRPGPPSSVQPPRPVVPAPAVRDDQSLLGRILGAEQAARLRARYADVQQRIVRRGRTPEERDRLTERAHRLNPDEWTDDRTIRVSAKAAEAEWDAILAELPARRRGRRGGRRRLEESEASASAPDLPDSARHADDESSSGLSVIIDERGGSNDGVSERGQVAGAGSPSGSAPDGGGVGPERAEPGAVPGDR
jgi:hypothetical protein